MLTSHDRGSVAINSSSSSMSSSSTIKPVVGFCRTEDPVPNLTGESKPVHINACDQPDSYSLSSVDVMDSNDLKFMDDSTSSSSTSSISGAVDLGSSSTSTASASPIATQSSLSQDTLKFDTRSPLASPLSNGPVSSFISNPASSRSASGLLVNGQSNASQHSIPVHRPTQLPRPSRIPVLTSLGRIKPIDVRIRSELVTHCRSFGNNENLPGKLSSKNAPLDSLPCTSFGKQDVDSNHPSLSESMVEWDSPNPQKHSQSDLVSTTPLPNGDVSRCFSDTSSPELSPDNTRSTSSRDERGNSNGKTTKNGFSGSTEFDEDHRLRELLAMVSDSESDTESIAESIYHQPPKAADRSAASRLAKRLFHLDGFRITDVAKHLCKRNDFSQLVGEEFASLFDFTNQRLDTALRTFLNTFSLTGESQERERILLHFSRRYHACNPDAYPNEEVCHTLVCALMLLNTDLHNQGVTRKMTCQEFINNLTQMHCGDSFSRDELKTLYSAIKQEPLRWPHQLPSIHAVTTGPDPAMMGFVNLYYSGPTGPYVPPGAAASGILTPTGLYPQNPNASMLLSAQGGSTTSFTPYSPMPYPAFPGLPYVPGSSGAGVNVPGTLATPQPILSSSPLAFASPLYWNTSASASIISTLNVDSSANPSSATSAGTETNGTTKTTVVAGSNPFIDLMAETSAREYMRGLLVRKWVMESRGKKTSLGRRGWKVYYARLRDLVLYLYKNAMVANAAARAEELHNLHQQQLQQHQSYMRQTAVQQQQLSSIHAADQSQALAEAECQDVKEPCNRVNQEIVNKTTAEPNGMDEKSATSTTTMMDTVQSASTETYQPAVSLQLESIENQDPNDGELDEFETTSDTERRAHQQTDGLNSSATTFPVGHTLQSDIVQSTPGSMVSGEANDSTFPIVVSTHTTTSTNLCIADNPGTSNSTTLPSISVAFPPTTQTPLPFVAPPSFVPPAIPPPEAVIRIAHAIASRATDYVKKPNVFRLKTREGAEYLFEVSDSKELDMWVERINFVAALLSAPAIPGPIGSERAFYPPHLPVTCTKLNMREQLEEHQRRLIELGRELTDLHKRLPIVSGSKTLKPTRASSISGRTSDAAKAAAAALLGRTSNKESVSGKKDESASNASADAEVPASKEQTDEGIMDASTISDTTSCTSAAVTNTSTSSTLSLISVFSTSSLGRRRKASSGSLCGTADTTFGPVLTAKQRAEHEERIQFTESEVHRYKTYARLLETELFRIQQSSAAIAHATALAAANNFSPYINPYGPIPGNLHGFQHYGPIGLGSASGNLPFPPSFPTQSPRYFLQRDHAVPAYAAATSNMLPLAVLGPSDPLTEESTNSDHPSDTVSSVSPLISSSGCVGNSPLPSIYAIPATVPLSGRPRSLPYSYYGPQLTSPNPYSPSVSGRFYSHPRQLRSSHYRQQQHPQQYGLGSGSFARNNSMMMMINGHKLTEEDTTSDSSPSCSTDQSSGTTEAKSSSTSTTTSVNNGDKYVVTLQSSQPVCSTEGMFYEIV